MNLLIANNRFFISGGPERYLFSLIDILEGEGHTVIPFSNTYQQNHPSPYAEHFLPPPVDAGSVYYREYRLNAWKKLELLGRAVYYPETHRRVTRLIETHKVDVAYLLAITHYISPSIITACRSKHVPVLMRLSDFNLLCPAYLFLRQGQPCEECLQYGLQRAIVHRCLQDSTLVSLARVIAMSIHRLMRVYDQVDAFITPSRFLLEKMVQGGFPATKMHHIPSPIQTVGDPEASPGDYILYFGRIAPEKGLESLLLGFELLQDQYPEAQLRIAGAPTPEQIRLVGMQKERGLRNIEFTGFLEGIPLQRLIAGARFTVCPSLCYENSPMTVLESLAHARPVIVSDIGSLPEQIVENVDGLLFEPGNPQQLAERMAFLWSNPELAIGMGKAGYSRVSKLHSPEAHLRSLMDVIHQVLN